MDFSENMLLCKNGFDRQAEIKIFPDESQWAVCPWCGKKAIMISTEAKIYKLQYKCRNSRCKKCFMINSL